MITRWMRVRMVYSGYTTDHNKPREKNDEIFQFCFVRSDAAYIIYPVCVWCFDFVTFYSGDIVSLSREWARAHTRTHPRSIDNNNPAMWLLVCCGAPCESHSFAPIAVFSDIKIWIAGGANEYDFRFNLMLMMVLMNSELRIISAAVLWKLKCQPHIPLFRVLFNWDWHIVLLAL